MRYRDECMPLTSFFRGYCLLTTTFAWRSLTTGGTIIFPLVFCVENAFPVFWYTLPPCHKICQTQSMLCVIEHRCVWSYSYAPILLAREYKPCRFARTCIMPPTLEAPGTQPLAMLLCGFFCGGIRNHYYLPLVLVMRPLATPISMDVRVRTEIQQIDALLTMIPTAVPWGFFYSEYYLFWDEM